jgi:RNA polymerase sigma-70 factor (ECF subfamily)
MTENQQLAEQEWILRAMQGSEEAFKLIVEAYQSPVFNLCYRMLGNKQEAEDAAQETFLRTYRNLRRYDPDRKFATWILSIASHYCIDRLRKKRLKMISLDGLLPRFEGPEKRPGPEDSLTHQEMQADVRAILGQLGSVDRAAIVLRYWYDCSYEEIAETLSLSVPAVKSRLHRARKSLAEQYSPEGFVRIEGGTCDEASAV